MSDALTSIEQRTRQILVEVVEKKDFDAGFDFINDLYDHGRKFGELIGMMIEGMERAWVPEEHEGETFLQAAVRRTPLHPTTIRRHSKIQRFLDSNIMPDNVSGKIKEAGQKSLVRIANAADKFDLTQKDWNKIAEVADDEKSLSMVLRKITDTAPRSNFLAITCDERGILMAHTAVEHIEFGRLNVNIQNPVVRRAIDRIVSSSGILPKVEY